MADQSFTLKPWNAAFNDFTITGCIRRPKDRLSIRFEVAGDLSLIAIPEPSENRCRKNRLWEKTCFEFFVGIGNMPAYWEFNLSPSGDWNVFRFKDYRNENSGNRLEEEGGYRSLAIRTRMDTECFLLDLDLDLGRIAPPDLILEIGVACVIELKNSEVRFFALNPAGPKPDFHRRSDFMIKI